MAVVAIAGIVISAVGALAGGIGFLAGMLFPNLNYHSFSWIGRWRTGMGITSSILMVLGIVGLIFDAISGAIQRSQLRDAINSLFKLRIQIKYLAEHAREVQGSIGGIKMLYAMFKEQGYNKDKIIQKLGEFNILASLQKQTRELTHVKVARDLLEMDKTRVGGSWREEDPALEAIASSLDAEVETKKRAGNGELSAPMRRKRSSGSPDQVAPEMRNSLESEKRLLQMGNDGVNYVVPEAEKKDAVSIGVIFKDVAPILQGPITITLKEFVDELSAAVQLKAEYHGPVKADTDLRAIGTTASIHVSDWVISFAISRGYRKYNQRKEALIEGIHETQVTRLVVNSLKQQARNITEQMSTMNMFLLILKSGDEVSAGKMANIMIGSIQEEDDKISLADLEDSLRVADKSTLKFYGADDLDKDTVVQRAQIDRDEDTTHFKIEKA
ncbi:hypothetical protein C0991_011498 [Blastosporella zonata]|nr:hypothetical protein C0991_011498 [Blastosporella zonata]